MLLPKACEPTDAVIQRPRLASATVRTPPPLQFSTFGWLSRSLDHPHTF